MNRRTVIGITGGVASGKSTVMKILAEHNIPGVSADDLAHQALRPGTSIARAILRRYGRKILQRSGRISREKLGGIVFKDATERKWLEKLVHPVVIHELMQFTRRRQGLIALDIPLLFEAGLNRLVDKVVVVYATQSQQIRRLMLRSGMSRDECLRRIKSQIPLSRKRPLADWVIDNSGSRDATRRQTNQLIDLFS